METVRLDIAHTTYVWITKRLGIDADTYAIDNANFAKWFHGEAKPTLKQAQDFAKKFYVPFSYLFLDEEPDETCPITFFRKKTTDKRQSVNISETIFLMQERQEWASDYIQSRDEDPIDFVGSMENETNVSKIANKIRTILELDDDWAKNAKTEEEAIKRLYSTMEAKGVFVMFNSVVGSNNSRPIEVDECRGFSLIDKYAPLIFINSKDAKAAQVFTLIHEFCHLLINYSAGFGGTCTEKEMSANEKLCNKVAADVLLPTDLFKKVWSNVGGDFSKLVRRFKVSRYVIARKACDLNLITKVQMNKLYTEWNNEVKIENTRSGGGDYYRMAIKKNSRSFLCLLNSALSTNSIMYTEAYHLSGMKGDTFHKLVNSEIF